MGWLLLIVGATLIVVAGRSLWRVRNDAAPSPISLWTFMALGSSVLLSGVSKLTRPGVLSTSTDVVSWICLLAAGVLLYRQHRRSLAK